MNNLLLSDAESFHAGIDSWTPPANTELFQIAGWGLDTVSGIQYYDGIRDGRPIALYKPYLTSDGDGTVTLESAWALPVGGNVKRYWINLKEASRGLKRNRGHADILEVADLRQLIKDIITKAPEAVPEPVSIPDDVQEKLRFFVHSQDVFVDAYDDAGNHTGIATSTGLAETAIPGSDFRQFGDVTYLSIPKPNVASVADIRVTVINGPASAPDATLEIDEVNEDTVATSTTYSDIFSSTKPSVVIDMPATSTSGNPPFIFEGAGDDNQSTNPDTEQPSVPEAPPQEDDVSSAPLTDNSPSREVRRHASVRAHNQSSLGNYLRSIGVCDATSHP